ncbi:MAG TPA: zinc-dependent alcohol dehydrogenase family protein [Acidimicrobiia bacterium]|jgi:propanol-preferring alcohol dehydrogenase
MRAWWVESPAPIDTHPLRFGDRDDPIPAPDEILVEVSVCGVCRTDLHLAEGDLAPHQPHAIPGHEVVGRVIERGASARRFELGERVGMAWLRHTCGVCRFCRSSRENLCVEPLFTGWDADGGYAERAVVPEAYAYRLPERLDDREAAPLLCAGIIGFRALRRAALPPGGRLGIYGFGASAHLAAQVAQHEGATVHVMTRSPAAQQLALELGAASAGGADAAPPEPLDSAILFAPVGELVPVVMRALDRGGTLAIAGIHLSDVPTLNYETELFEERQLRSVTANTRADGEEFLQLAAGIGLRPTIVPYPLSDADRALADVAHDRLTGAAVLDVAV